MAVDEQARHRLYRRLEEVLGPEEAGTLMNHLPSAGLADLATKSDLHALELRLTAEMERFGRRLIMWTSSMVMAAGVLAIAAGRYA